MAKRAYDGSPLWTCEHCGQAKRRKDMYSHGDAGNVCKACHDDTDIVDRGGLKISWAVAKNAPDDDEKARDAAIWKHVGPFLCYYRLKENKVRFQEKAYKKRILPAIFKRSRVFPEHVHEPVLQAMADYDLDPRTTIWLALREGVFDKFVQRQLAIEAAEQAVQFTDAATQHPMVHGVLNALHRFTSDDNIQSLSLPREQIYNIQKNLVDEVFVKKQVQRAFDAVAAACFRSSFNAATVAMSYAYEALELERVEPETIVTTFADTVRSLAQRCVSARQLPAVKHWDGLEEV